jgi:ABC-type lipoprotein export system ATPase subunit
MSALESIIKWALNDLPDWQSDAVRRLLTQEELSDKDEEEIFKMLKGSCDLLDKKELDIRPNLLNIGDISGVPQVETKITLKAIQNLYGINALPDGSFLPFGHKGLTVVYGENGTGKSGYARVLKKACRARDTKQKILPDVFCKDKNGPAKAEFKFSINDGEDDCVFWEDDKEEKTIMSNVCVFDSKCARVIIDEKNEAVYLPYGAHVFEDLVNLLKKLRLRLEGEKSFPDKLEYPDISKTTGAGNFIDKLSYKSKISEIEELSLLSKENEAELLKLKKKIAKIEADDPNKQIIRIRNTKDRIQGILDQVNKIDVGLSNSKVDILENDIKRLVAAEKALEIASKETLTNEPLPGAGGNEWQILYNAAKKYSLAFAYPNKDFPVIDEGSRCVLCMQPLLEDGIKRMLRFKKFMDQAVKKERDAAEKQLKDDLNEIKKLDFPPIDSYKDLLVEIQDRDKKFYDLLKDYFPGMQKRAEEIIKSATEQKHRTLPLIKPSPKDSLEKIIEAFESEAVTMEKSAKSAEFERIKSKYEELKARKMLAERKPKILKYLNQLKKDKKYDKCIEKTKFRHITLKGKKIISNALTPILRNAFMKELKALNANYLPLKIESSGAEGETLHNIQIDKRQTMLRANPSDILSEGEQKVVAIAGFLAELSIENHECPIVLDDPVCSLDHKYREKIATRLVKEAKKRQVIIFTHDIEFLTELKKKAGECDDVHFYALTMHRDAERVGLIIEGLPWHSMSVKDRIKYLNGKLEEIGQLHKSNIKNYNSKVGFLYNLLRETWESLVEQDLLFETVLRHGSEVQTQRLKSVTITTEDYKKIHINMSKCSKWMFGHDKSKSTDVNRPSPNELKEDIENINTFSKEIRKRRETLRKEREKSLEPVAPEVG